ASEVRALADDVIVLAHGRVAGQGPPERVLSPGAIAAADPEAEPVALLAGRVAAREGEVARVTTPAGEVEVVAPAAPGAALRLEVPAASVALAAPGGPPATSARNRIAAKVLATRALGDAVLVELEAGDARLYATVTPRSARELALVPGAEVVAVLKATAVRVI